MALCTLSSLGSFLSCGQNTNHYCQSLMFGLFFKKDSNTNIASKYIYKCNTPSEKLESQTLINYHKLQISSTKSNPNLKRPLIPHIQTSSYVLVIFISHHWWRCQQDHHRLTDISSPNLCTREEERVRDVFFSFHGIILVTCCTSSFLVKELTGTGSDKYLEVWRPSMPAFHSACGAPQGKINIYILEHTSAGSLTP